MNTTFSTRDIQTLLTFPFRDSNWKTKFLIGSVLIFAGFIVPVVPFVAVLGYMAEIMRRLILEDGQLALPEWDDWGNLFVRGLRMIGVIFIYLLPSMALFVVAYGFMFMIPMIMAILSEGRSSVGPAEVVLPMVFPFGFMFLFFLSMGTGIIASILLPPALTHMVARDEFAAAFRITEWGAVLRRNLWGFLVGYVISLGLATLIGWSVSAIYISVILCLFMPLLLSPLYTFLSWISGAVFAQAYRESVDLLEVVEETV